MAQKMDELIEASEYQYEEMLRDKFAALFVVRDDWGEVQTTAREIYALCLKSNEYFKTTYRMFKDLEFLVLDGCVFSYLKGNLFAVKPSTTFKGKFNLRDWPDELLAELFNFIYPYLK